jgi:hypothetical protein
VTDPNDITQASAVVESAGGPGGIVGAALGAYEDNVIAAQNAVAAADPDVYIIAPTSPLPDGVHFSAAALVQLGQNLAADIIAEGA